MRRLLAVTAVVPTALGLLVAIAPTAQAAASAGAAYTPLSTPVRVANAVSVGPRREVTKTLSGVPSDATAVAVNITAGGGSAQGYLTVYQAGTSRPGTSSVNFAAGQTVANAAIVRLAGSAAAVRVYNGSSRTAHFYLDLEGYYTASGAGQGSFGAITPTRVLSTPTGVGAKGPIGSHRTVSFAATGGSTGIPSSASAVLINVTAAKPTRAGYLTVYAGSRPAASTLNFSPGATLAHLTVVPIGSSGRVSVYNGSGGTVQAFGDVLGWFAAGDPTAPGALGVLSPYRVLSSKTIGAHRTVSVSAAGRGGVPKSGVSALALNVRVTKAVQHGYLAVDPGSPVRTSTLNFTKGQSVANLVLARASGGSLRIYNGSSASVEVSADVTGYLLATGADVPVTSTSDYVRNITGATSDASTMASEGRADCAGGSRLVLLDIGAQSNTTPTSSSNGVVLSASDPGVRLSATAVRLTYAQLVTAIEGYLDGFAGCTGTIAVSTSNDGDWTAYPAASKAKDWASVIGQLTTYAASEGYTGETIDGAGDIEAAFASTAAQARSWVADYLDDPGASSRFIENGSLDNCAATYGSSAECGAVAGQTGPTWTRADYQQLTTGIAPNRIQVLPQIYHASQAVQWADLDNSVSGSLVFAGALTEHAAACGSDCSFTPTEGWAALHHALSTVLGTPSIPGLTDLEVDDTSASPATASAAQETPGDGA